jgi:hypothetical protein
VNLGNSEKEGTNVENAWTVELKSIHQLTVRVKQGSIIHSCILGNWGYEKEETKVWGGGGRSYNEVNLRYM